jgi:hypothetical protein
VEGEGYPGAVVYLVEECLLQRDGVDGVVGLEGGVELLERGPVGRAGVAAVAYLASMLARWSPRNWAEAGMAKEVTERRTVHRHDPQILPAPSPKA